MRRLWGDLLMSYTFHMTNARLHNRGRPPNMPWKPLVIKVSLRRLSFQENAFLHRLLYLAPSCKRCPPAEADACSRPSAWFTSHDFLPVHAQPHAHKHVFATFELVYPHTRAAHANSKPFFVSSVNKNAIYQPHITPVLNHRSHLAPWPFCTSWISQPPISSERSAPSNPSQSALCERKQARFLFRHRQNALASNLLLIPDHTRDQ